MGWIGDDLRLPDLGRLGPSPAKRIIAGGRLSRRSRGRGSGASYGEQGDYIRRRSNISAVPEASDFGVPANCGNYWHRSVFVEWQDYEGTYGHEEVHY